MKKFCLTITTAVFLLICLNGLQAQTTQTKLNQVELLKQFLGTWKSEIAKDTTIIGDYTPFGTAVESNLQIVTNNKILDSWKRFCGYDKINDRLIIAKLMKSSPVIEISEFWFTSKNAGEGFVIQDISHPENTTIKWKIEFKSPDLYIQTVIQNNKTIAVRIFNREKK
ncbi:MAG TPA: hypothetical protein VIK14_10895 [Ignavibacteria bacterium]